MDGGLSPTVILALQVLAPVVFLVPGFVYLWTFERLAGRFGLTLPDRVFRATAWSTAFYAAGGWWIASAADRVSAGRAVSAGELYAGGVLLLFVVPISVGIALAVLRLKGIGAPFRRLSAVDPMPTSWEYVFASGRSYFMRIRLKSGATVGGFYGD